MEQKCLICLKKSLPNKLLCKKHRNKKFTPNEYSKLSLDTKDKICSTVLKSGIYKNKICSRVGKDGICNYHNRIKNGLCNVKYCNNTALFKNSLCQQHINDKFSQCPCGKHFNICIPIKKSYDIPDEIILYIFNFNGGNDKRILSSCSKKFKKHCQFKFLKIYQVNIPETELFKKLNQLFNNFEKIDVFDYQNKINNAKEIFEIILKNLYLLNKYKKFFKITIEKSIEFEEYDLNFGYYRNLIIDGICQEFNVDYKTIEKRLI